MKRIDIWQFIGAVENEEFTTTLGIPKNDK